MASPSVRAGHKRFFTFEGDRERMGGKAIAFESTIRIPSIEPVLP